jgi:hypothetical protein
MPPFDPAHFDTEGPLGLPMKDAQAQMLDSVLKALPAEDRQLARVVVAKAPTEVKDGARSDVSWISTDEIDRDQEIVVAKGMNDSQFKLNPIVTRPPCCRKSARAAGSRGEQPRADGDRRAALIAPIVNKTWLR